MTASSLLSSSELSSLLSLASALTPILLTVFLAEEADSSDGSIMDAATVVSAFDRLS
jgi:hypothetical protein